MDEDMSEMDTTAWMTRLPDIVLLMIFGNLTSITDLINCSMVCKRWKDLAYSKVLWKDRHIKINALKPDIVQVSSESFKERSVKKITLFIPDDQIESSHRDLNVFVDAVRQFIAITHLLTDTLEEITVNGFCLSDYHISAAFDQPMKNIKSVSLICHGIYTPASIRTVLRNCPNIRQLTHSIKQSPDVICTYEEFHPDTMVGRLTDSLTVNISVTLSSIVHLDLSDSTITNNGIRNIAQLRHLNCLFLRHCYYLTAECIDILSAARCPIKQLDLTWCAHIDSKKLLTKIGNSCLFLEHLFVHSMMGFGVNDEDLDALVRSGQACNLKEFVIDGMSKVSLSGIRMLCNKCKSLKSFIHFEREMILPDRSVREMTRGESAVSSTATHEDVHQELINTINNLFHPQDPASPFFQSQNYSQDYSNEHLSVACRIMKKYEADLLEMMERHYNPPHKMEQIFFNSNQKNIC